MLQKRNKSGKKVKELEDERDRGGGGGGGGGGAYDSHVSFNYQGSLSSVKC